MSDLAVFSGTAVVPGWRWRTAREGQLPPAEMETSHLFNTLRMIWNNHMPASMRVGAVRLFRFCPQRHPRHYLGEAILQIGRELMRRPDITPGMRVQLEQMARHLNRTAAVAGSNSSPEPFHRGKETPQLEYRP